MQIALGSTGTVEQAYDLLKLDYGYGTTNNNGNVLSQKITVKRPNQSDLVLDQLYTYDSLNRITSTEEKTGTTVNWNLTYTFDRYGNRNFNESLTTTLPKGCMNGSTPVVCEADKKSLNPVLNASDNRMAAGQGWSYDAAGNVIGDPQGRKFIYDAENKQVEVENSLEQSIGKYWFDGDGKRIKKDGIAPNGQPELTVFVYDAGGKLIGEYSTNVETAAPKVQYLTADHLGSPRINTDQNGTVTSRTDYMPYGEDIIALGNRTANEAYSPDDIRKGFTGYEKDDETALEYAQARMYSPTLGRFASHDPIYISREHSSNPQSWNVYVYVFNNPLNKIDPDGRKAKQVIDVYIAFDNYTADQIKEIKNNILKGLDRKKVVLNIFDWEKSTPDNVAQSLRSKGRTVIIAGHINGGDGEETGERRSNGKPKTAANSIVLNGGLLRSDGIYVYGPQGDLNRVNTERIRASSVFAFSCGLTPNAASQFAGRMESGGTFVYSDGGDDTGTEIGVTVRFANLAARLVGNGMSASSAAGIIQDVSDAFEQQRVAYQNGDNIIPCRSNGTCGDKRHKLAPR